MASLDPDRLLDRRRLKRGVAIWRALAVVALVALALVAAAPFAFEGGERVARLWVTGLIEDDPARDRIIADLKGDDAVKAVVLRLDSAGGTAVGGEALYLSLRSLAAAKPVVAVLGTTATSAAYMAALAADHVVAREATLTGSIGILFQTAEFTALLEEIGVRAEAIRSGPLKAKPTPFEELDNPTRHVMRTVVTDIYESFLRLVMERRSLDRETALTVADGRVFTGSQAVEAGLVDAIGGEEEARAWLAAVHGVSESIPATDVVSGGENGLFDVIDAALERTLPARTLALDGLIAVWHPQITDWNDDALGDRTRGPGASGRRSISSMTKSELIQLLADRHADQHLYHRDYQRVVNRVFTEISDALAQGDRVELRGFGAFSVRPRAARVGRNPRTGTSVRVDRKFLPFFKTGKELRERLNSE